MIGEKLIAALRGERSSLASLDARLDDLKGQISRLRSLPPDRDAVLAWAHRTIDQAEATYLRNLREWYLSPAHVERTPGEWFDGDDGPSWLLAQTVAPGAGPSQPRLDAKGVPLLDHEALLYLLGPVLRERLPGIIAACFPFADSAMPSAERRKRVVQLETQVAQVEGEREQLVASLEATRAAIDEALP